MSTLQLPPVASSRPQSTLTSPSTLSLLPPATEMLVKTRATDKETSRRGRRMALRLHIPELNEKHTACLKTGSSWAPAATPLLKLKKALSFRNLGELGLTANFSVVWTKPRHSACSSTVLHVLFSREPILSLGLQPFI